MTAGMNERRNAFEKKFALDAELRFKAEARRNKILGLWAAEKLGKKDAEAEAYAREVIAADLEEAGDEDVFRKIRGDFDAAGVSESDAVIREKLIAFLEEAVAQVKSE